VPSYREAAGARQLIAIAIVIAANLAGAIPVHVLSRCFATRLLLARSSSKLALDHRGNSLPNKLRDRRAPSHPTVIMVKPLVSAMNAWTWYT
jgi:hypothetical protein